MNRREVIESGTQSYVKEIRKLREINHALGAKIKKLEAERPKGHWIWYEVRGQMLPYCSECGNGLDVIYEYNFCPDCGADMRGEGDDE